MINNDRILANLATPALMSAIPRRCASNAPLPVSPTPDYRSRATMTASSC